MAATLAQRIVRAPRPHDPNQVAGIAARFGDLDEPARALLEGAAGCSAFLAGLIEREADWLRAALDTAPEEALAGILAGMPAEGTAALADSLRIARGRTALLVALADLGGAWGLGEVTHALTALADRAVGLGL
ncbi:MAG TPA: glutamine-synthetase adenylyltransferase, partial [Amaricoccus sp.]|nr:glutamine-synthetase adenylyltransferase [Amaricoccus sp.]